ncbi:MULTISPECIES: hypothetical protein [unclassified Nonomuraea]|uniref:hypothetical protein n=1 Tax=unclassified Nonomuraea TaxID=2593643 RepID=UPI0033C77800
MSENVAEQPPLPALTRALVGPPGKVLLPLVAVVGLLMLDHTSMPGGGSFTLLLAGLLLAVGTVVVWVARFAVGLLRSDGRPGLRRHWARWAAAPLMGVTVIALVFTGVPFEVRFALSESRLEQFARTVAADTKAVEHEDQWVGLYPLTSIGRVPGGARFLVSDTGLFDRYGFAWSPGGEPPEESHTGYTHLEGPWYVWESRF